MLQDQLEIVTIGDGVVPDEPARFALLHAIADLIEAVGETHRAKRDLTRSFFCGFFGPHYM